MISIDFIVKLPVSKELGLTNRYDSMFVIVDWLSKYTYFILCREDMTVEEFVYLFYRTVTSRYGIPAEIILDRDKLFKNKFWQSLTTRLGAEHKISTAYYL